jgi:hypothetical protein
LQRALRHPSRDQVVATVIGGDIVHDAR